jgi:hypothetical protein
VLKKVLIHQLAVVMEEELVMLQQIMLEVVDLVEEVEVEMVQVQEILLQHHQHKDLMEAVKELLGEEEQVVEQAKREEQMDLVTVEMVQPLQ